MIPRDTRRLHEFDEPLTVHQLDRLWHQPDERFVSGGLSHSWRPRTRAIISIAQCGFVILSLAILASTVWLLRLLGGA
jgi:hypothetical protein